MSSKEFYERVKDIEASNPAFFLGKDPIDKYYYFSPRYELMFYEDKILPINIKNKIEEAYRVP